MQEIEYEDGEKTKKEFATFMEALLDAEEKATKRTIKKLVIKRIIPKKRNGRMLNKQRKRQALER